MKTLSLLLASASLVASLVLVAPVFAEPAEQTIVLHEVDTTVLATGWRATALIGAVVYNDAGEEIGQLDDLIITESDTVPYAVISVGGFLGMGAHHVVVSTAALEMMELQLTLHGATAESLRALPNFTFAS